MSQYRLPHESPESDLNRAPAPTVFRAAPAGRAAKPLAVDAGVNRRRQARRTVTAITAGVGVAAGLGVGGLAWAAQQSSGVVTAATTTASSGATTGTTSATSGTTTGTTSSTSSSSTTTVQAAQGTAVAATHSS